VRTRGDRGAGPGRCVFLGAPPVARLLGGAWPSATGWVLAASAIPVLLLADTFAKGIGPGGPAATRTHAGELISDRRPTRSAPPRARPARGIRAPRGRHRANAPNMAAS